MSPPPRRKAARSLGRRVAIALAHVGLIGAVIVVLYPVMLVCKKAFEPGRQFALSASPIPHSFTTAHFRELFSERGADPDWLLA